MIPMVEANEPFDPTARGYVDNLLPMTRWGRNEEVAEAILLLLASAASFMTVAELTVDGGVAHV
jgi:NAD(P)-dependent dehydrogenase (short-subunit alcohol dehydrogenase family)